MIHVYWCALRRHHIYIVLECHPIAGHNQCLRYFFFVYQCVCVSLFGSLARRIPETGDRRPEHHIKCVCILPKMLRIQLFSRCDTLTVAHFLIRDFQWFFRKFECVKNRSCVTSNLEMRMYLHVFYMYLPLLFLLHIVNALLMYMSEIKSFFCLRACLLGRIKKKSPIIGLESFFAVQSKMILRIFLQPDVRFTDHLEKSLISSLNRLLFKSLALCKIPVSQNLLIKEYQGDNYIWYKILLICLATSRLFCTNVDEKFKSGI